MLEVAVEAFLGGGFGTSLRRSFWWCHDCNVGRCSGGRIEDGSGIAAVFVSQRSTRMHVLFTIAPGLATESRVVFVDDGA